MKINESIPFQELEMATCFVCGSKEDLAHSGHVHINDGQGTTVSVGHCEKHSNQPYSPVDECKLHGAGCYGWWTTVGYALRVYEY